LTTIFTSHDLRGHHEHEEGSLFLGFAMMLAMTIPLSAQTGCGDSLENPTAVLALVGGASALFSAVRAKVRMRRNSSQQ
jgi:XrtJ-associated TM-motif-TM protein